MMLQMVSLIVEDMNAGKLQLSIFSVPDVTAMKLSKMIREKLEHFL